MIILTYKYYIKITHLKKEYDIAKQLVSNIVLTFRKRIDDHNEKVNSIKYDVEELQTTIEKSRIEVNYFQDKINNLIKGITSAFITNKKLVDKLIDINKKINELKKYNEILYNTIESFNKNQKESLQKPILNLSHDQHSNFNKLTTTERQIIRILLSEGAKTAPNVMGEIRKTREHTSRLMKKLWQEGYIERDTNSIPFIYRPTKELEKIINV